MTTTTIEIDLLRRILDDLAATFDGCDHSVGICECSTREAHAEATLRLDGRRSCETCGGYGIGELDGSTCAGCDVKGTRPDRPPLLKAAWAVLADYYEGKFTAPREFRRKIHDLYLLAEPMVGIEIGINQEAT